mmetsp:Transcript_17102/g.66605  ORF Transcript_17102/g.66605 Transcript_17102/m.66605 type:complete len:427 (-) Transcript_17102:1152-2432(-)
MTARPASTAPQERFACDWMSTSAFLRPAFRTSTAPTAIVSSTSRPRARLFARRCTARRAKTHAGRMTTVKDQFATALLASVPGPNSVQASHHTRRSWAHHHQKQCKRIAHETDNEIIHLQHPLQSIELRHLLRLNLVFFLLLPCHVHNGDGQDDAANDCHNHRVEREARGRKPHIVRPPEHRRGRGGEDDDVRVRQHVRERAKLRFSSGDRDSDVQRRNIIAYVSKAIIAVRYLQRQVSRLRERVTGGKLCFAIVIRLSVLEHHPRHVYSNGLRIWELWLDVGAQAPLGAQAIETKCFEIVSAVVHVVCERSDRKRGSAKALQARVRQNEDVQGTVLANIEPCRGVCSGNVGQGVRSVDLAHEIASAVVVRAACRGAVIARLALPQLGFVLVPLLHNEQQVVIAVHVPVSSVQRGRDPGVVVPVES